MRKRKSEEYEDSPLSIDDRKRVLAARRKYIPGSLKWQSWTRIIQALDICPRPGCSGVYDHVEGELCIGGRW